jgi:hypothetical protein
MCKSKTIRKRLFYDIETSFCQGHFWRPGWGVNILPHQIIKHAQIICISWKWEGKEEVHHLDWGLKKQCDKALLKKFIKELDKADEIIAHNGDRFDIKWIRTRALFHGLEMKHSYNSIDTLKWTKKYLNLPSNKLAEICKYYNLVNKLDAGGMSTWTDIVFHKSQEALDRMVHYCDGDIHSLEAVFNKLLPYTKPNMHYGVLKGGSKWGCPECGGLPNYSSSYTTAAGTVQVYLKCKDRSCSTYNRTYKVNNKTYMDLLQYKMINNIK